MLKTGDALIVDLGDAIERDPEVRQARTIADAARKRLVACMDGGQDEIDAAEAQRMLDAFTSARAHAEDAEDRVLMHRGLLTPAEAGRRAARRRPAAAGTRRPDPAAAAVQAGRDAACARGTRRAVAWILALMAAAAAGVALARRLGVRRRPARW